MGLPKITGVDVRALRVPMAQPHRTASGVVAESPLVLTDVRTDTGAVGHSITFTYTAAALDPTAALIRSIGALIEGEELAPAEIEQKLARRFRLLGVQGLVGMALAGIDMAFVTGWMRAAGMAAAHGIPVSNHLWPEISAQLLSVTPTAHWLEYADWWNAVLTEPARVEDGYVVASAEPGSGVSPKLGGAIA